MMELATEQPQWIGVEAAAEPVWLGSCGKGMNLLCSWVARPLWCRWGHHLVSLPAFPEGVEPVVDVVSS